MNAKLKELDLGIREQVDALVLDVMERETKTGKPYVVLKVTDGDTTAEVKKWDARLDDFLPVKRPCMGTRQPTTRTAVCAPNARRRTSSGKRRLTWTGHWMPSAPVWMPLQTRT